MIRSFLGRLGEAWAARPRRERLHLHLLAWLMAGSIAHFLVFSIYYIEDAGISFAYARHFVEGEGWVTYPGGERVEGFSNPLWTWLIAMWYAVGVPPFTSSKVMGAILGAACLPLSWALARRARPDADDHVALLPPLFLAASSTFAIWNASGLENSLFSFLMTLGMLQVLRESEDETGKAFPWSALAFLGLALTRPEGLVYAAIGGWFRLLLALQSGPVLRPILSWILTFWLPFAAYQAWRYDYFGWAFPNTYYAKMDGEQKFRPFVWSGQGWKYIQNFAKAFGFAYAAPLFAVGLVGLRDRRRWLVLAVSLLGALFLAWNGRAGLPAKFDPDWLAWMQRNWDMLRLGVLLGGTALLTALTQRDGAAARVGVALIGLGGALGASGLQLDPEAIPALGENGPETIRMALIGIGSVTVILGVCSAVGKGAAVRTMAMAMAGAGLFFILLSGGDWMKQWRFFSYLAVPGAIILGLGVGELLQLLAPSGRWPRWAIGGALLTVLLAPNIWQSSFSAPAPETSISDVKRRVEYMSWVQRRLQLEQVTLFDVDMGAHMYYTDWRIRDIAGLVDVPMARHNYQNAFIQQYIFEEAKPEFAHLHGGWANKVKATAHEEWARDYIEIPGYPSGGRTLHIGNHVRKDIFVKDAYAGPRGRKVVLADDVVIEGWEVPSAEVPAGGELYLEYWLTSGFRKKGFRVLLVLDDGAGHQAVSALPPGYDWYAPQDWDRGEHVIQRYDLPLPESLPEGTYDLGFVVIDEETGMVLGPVVEAPESTAVDGAPAAADPAPVPEAPVRYMRGEVFFEDAVTIVSRDVAETAAQADRAAALDHAAGGRCEEAWESWRQARYHVWKNKAWHADYQQEVGEAIALCYVARAAAAPNPQERVRWLLTARDTDFRSEGVVEACSAMADVREAEADAFFAEERWKEAYAAYSDAVALDPSRSQVRRRAEEARDQVLGVKGKEKDKPPSKAKTPTKKAPAEVEVPDEEPGGGE